LVLYVDSDKLADSLEDTARVLRESLQGVSVEVYRCLPQRDPGCCDSSLELPAERSEWQREDYMRAAAAGVEIEPPDQLPESLGNWGAWHILGVQPPRVDLLKLILAGAAAQRAVFGLCTRQELAALAGDSLLCEQIAGCTP
jgi:hypothetical protein